MVSKKFLALPLAAFACIGLASCQQGNSEPSVQKEGDSAAHSDNTVTIEDCALAFYRSNKYRSEDLLGTVGLDEHSEVPIAGYGANQYLYVCFELSRYDNRIAEGSTQLSFTVRITGLQGFSISGDETYDIASINNGETYEVTFNTMALDEGEVDTFLRLPFFMKRDSATSSGSDQRADFEVNASLMGVAGSSKSLMRTQSTFSWTGGTELEVSDPVLDTRTGRVRWNVDGNATECRVTTSDRPGEVSGNLLLQSNDGDGAYYDLPRDHYVDNGLLTIRTHSDHVGYADVDKALSYKVLSTPTMEVETTTDANYDQTFSIYPTLGSSEDLYTNKIKLQIGSLDPAYFTFAPSVDVTNYFKENAGGRAEFAIASAYDGPQTNIVDSAWSNTYTVQKLESPTASIDGASLNWTSVLGANLYAIFEDGALLTTTNETTYRIGSSFGKTYAVKAVFDPISSGVEQRADEVYVNSGLSNAVTSNII